jgi:hypothetical protein
VRNTQFAVRVASVDPGQFLLVNLRSVACRDSVRVPFFWLPDPSGPDRARKAIGRPKAHAWRCYSIPSWRGSAGKGPKLVIQFHHSTDLGKGHLRVFLPTQSPNGDGTRGTSSVLCSVLDAVRRWVFDRRAQASLSHHPTVPPGRGKDPSIRFEMFPWVRLAKV